LTDQIIKEKTSYGSIKEFAEAVNAGSASLKELGIKPVFRLHPARKGLRSTKKTAQEGGALGFHNAMGDLIRKMR
jgi:large subunit ribosomal protein L30